MTDPDPTGARPADDFDAAAGVAEVFQPTGEDVADEERVVVRDPDTGHVTEEPAP